MKVTHAAAKSLQLCPTLCNPIDSSPPGSAIPGTLQARTLEWVAIFFSNVWKWKGKVKSLSHVWLKNPMDCSLPGSSIHGIFQARVLEWGAIAFSNMLSRLVITFLSRSKRPLISWLQSLCSDFGAPKNKIWYCFHWFSIYLPWSDGTRCRDLSFLNVEF